MAFDSGTSATFRDIMIYSLEKQKPAYEAQPYAKSKWLGNDSIELEIDLGHRHMHFPELRKGYETYVEKVLWKDGNSIKTGSVVKRPLE